jgi:methionine biosynthesis protein MetW
MLMTSLLYDQVLEWLPEKARVLDLGTGDGAFLERLVKTRGVLAEGVECDAALVSRCIDRGLVVHQGDILDGLDQYSGNAFDYVLLLGTLQELSDPQHVLREAFRVGRRVIASYSNLAHLQSRLQLLLHGRAPVTDALPSAWYQTRNTHFFSVLDFHEFCRATGFREIRTVYFNRRGVVNWLPNLRAERAVALLEKTMRSSSAGSAS